MTAPDHATKPFRNTLRERGHPYMGFLGACPFPAKTPADEGWISLDFLGFSRPNRDLSEGYAGKSADNFSWRFPRTVRPPGRQPTVEACGRARLFMSQA
jgi:hypothetical protein